MKKGTDKNGRYIGEGNRDDLKSFLQRQDIPEESVTMVLDHCTLFTPQTGKVFRTVKPNERRQWKEFVAFIESSNDLEHESREKGANGPLWHEIPVCRVKSIKVNNDNGEFNFDLPGIASEFDLMIRLYKKYGWGSAGGWVLGVREGMSRTGSNSKNIWILRTMLLDLAKRKQLGRFDLVGADSDRRINILTYKILAHCNVVQKIRYPSIKDENKMNAFVSNHL